MNQAYKEQVGQDAIRFIEPDTIIGVGTGSTVAYFIEALAKVKGELVGCVPSSVDTEQKLKSHNIPILDVHAGPIALYVDGADEYNDRGQLIKGGGGALTREKIIRYCSDKFICIVDESKHVKVLGEFPVAVEVIPMARSLAAREIVQLGGDPVYREGFITDNGNIILDVYNLDLSNPTKVEEQLNQVTGSVCNGLFAKRGADLLLVAGADGIKEVKPT